MMDSDSSPSLKYWRTNGCPSTTRNHLFDLKSWKMCQWPSSSCKTTKGSGLLILVSRHQRITILLHILEPMYCAHFVALFIRYVSAKTAAIMTPKTKKKIVNFVSQLIFHFYSRLVFDCWVKNGIIFVSYKIIYS